MSFNNDDIEQKIIEKGLTAPRITKAEIDALIEKFEYHFHRFEGTTTIVCAVFLDGFSVALDTSACISPENFDEGIGLEIAKAGALKKAISKLWELEGYALRKQIRSPSCYSPDGQAD